MIAFILLQYKTFRNRVLKLSFWDEVKVALISLIAVFFLLWVYAVAWRLLSYLNQVAMIGPLLVNKVLALVFLTSFAMVVFSGLITSFNTIFNSRDLDWLMAKPVSIRQLFTFKALTTSFYASWMVVVALVPFIVALGQVKNLSVLFYSGTFFLLIPFLVLAALTGMVISLLLMRFFPAKGTRDILLILGVVVMAGLYILFRFMQPERLVRPDGLEVVAQYLSYLDAPTAVYLPSWWITAGIFSLISGNTGDFAFYAVLLYGSAACLMAVLAGSARNLYYIGWTQKGEKRGQGKSRKGTGSPTGVGVACPHIFPVPIFSLSSFPVRGSFKALLAKDFTIFFRDTGQWSQLLILGAIVVVYLFSIYKLPFDTLYLQNLIAFVNIGLIGFILAAVALRLIFPTISTEGKSAWLLYSCPITPEKLFWEKLVFGSIPIMLLAVILAVTSNLILKTDFTVFWMTSLATLIMSIGLCFMAAGFGSVFPRFDLTNVVQIESSAGGIFYIITSLFYIALNLSLWAVPVRYFYRTKFSNTSIPWEYAWWLGITIALINIVTFILPAWLGIRSLKRIDRKII